MWIKQLAQQLLLEKILKQGRDNLFLILQYVHGHSYIQYNNITQVEGLIHLHMLAHLQCDLIFA